jgi:hypothetical protein
MAVAALALCLSGAALATATGHLGNATASTAPVTKTVVTETSNVSAAMPVQEDPSLAAPAPTLASKPAAPVANDAPPWSRRYKGPAAQVPVAAPAPVLKTASKDVKAADPAPAPPAETAAAPATAPSMDQASKTAQLLREQLNSSVK